MTERILGKVVQRFLTKSVDYGDVFNELGLAGQYSDMHRKMYKLKRAMWEGRPLKGEQPEEILEDLLGNILISLYLYAQDRETNQRSAGAQPSGGQNPIAQGAAPGDKEGSSRQQDGDAIQELASS